MSEYEATVQRVIDGDTFVAEVRVWPAMTWTGSIRLRGYDTPELRGKCPIEKQNARLARAIAARWIAEAAQRVRLTNVSKGQFAGRVIADVTDGGELLGEHLVQRGVARRVKGRGRFKKSWCADAGQLTNEGPK